MGYKKTVVLSFMLPGCTKFAPDRHFRFIKKLYWRTQVVCQMSIIGGNIPQLISVSTGHTLVHFHDWSQFLLKYFETIPNIASFMFFNLTNIIQVPYLFASIPDLLRNNLQSSREKAQLQVTTQTNSCRKA